MRPPATFAGSVAASLAAWVLYQRLAKTLRSFMKIRGA
jgi:hypothetical protein